MKKNILALLCLSMVFALVSCESTKYERKGREVEQPSGSSKRLKPHNEMQRFESEAALGPLATPRR